MLHVAPPCAGVVTRVRVWPGRGAAAIDAVEKGEDHALPMANGSAAAITGPVSVDALGDVGEDWSAVITRAEAARRATSPWS